MKINSGELIKTMRKEMRLSQESLAAQLFISTRQLARIESGEASMDVWQFISTLELLGQPTEDFWLLYLSSSEYDSYKNFKHLKRQLKNGDISEMRQIISDIEKGPLIKQPFIKQFIALVNTAINTELQPHEALEELQKAMGMSKPNFDETMIAQYRMTHNEIFIALTIAQCLSAMGAHDRAVSMIQAMIEGRENAKVSEEDKTVLFPSLYYVLSHILSSTGRFKEAIKACNNALEVCREYNNLKNVPEILLCLASCYHQLGEEEHIYKTYLVRAYHCAYAIGKNTVANEIKNEADKTYGITIL